MTSSKLNIELSKASNICGPNPDQLRQWCAWVPQQCAAAREISFRWIDEVESAELNARYRHREGATNVLSFGYQSEAGIANGFLGDIAICAPLVKKEADAQGKEEAHHWAHLVIHGILHLIGYDHETEIEAAKMESIEINLLHNLGIANPYQGGSNT